MSVAIASFAVFAASQVGTPGPANMALLATGARYGFRQALPFMLGVALGKQMIIWPIGFGLIGVISNMPIVFTFLKVISAAYIVWLSYKIANLRLDIKGLSGTPPGFFAGLIVHPLNPKAWGMIITGYTSFVLNEMSMLSAILTISIILFFSQIVLHPLWCWGGQRLALLVKGKSYERYLMWILASLTLISVFYALSQGF